MRRYIHQTSTEREVESLRLMMQIDPLNTNAMENSMTIMLLDQRLVMCTFFLPIENADKTKIVIFPKPLRL